MNEIIQKLKEKTGRTVTPDTLYKAKRAAVQGKIRSGLSPKLARDLEEATGISRLMWLYPGEYGDPFERYLLTR